ncbi:MAG: hypothetical protein QW692_03365 [Nitrososphaerota archaeon]
MAGVRIIPIELLIREHEGRLRRIVEASRILPELLVHAEDVYARLRGLCMLRDAGVREIALDPEGESVREPYPDEVLEIMPILRSFPTWYPSVVRGSDGRAYVHIYSNAHRACYAVVGVGEWPRLRPEPDIEYRGLKAYSGEAVIGYLEACKNYMVKSYAAIYGSRFPAWDADRIISELRMDDAEAYMILDSDEGIYSLHDDWRVLKGSSLADFTSRGIIVVRRINRGPFSSEWIGHIYALYPDDVQRRVLEEYRRMRDEDEESRRRIGEDWKRIAEEMGGKAFLRISADRLEEALKGVVHQSTRKSIMMLIREYCDPDEIYLVRICSGALKLERRSPYHPIKLLYLVRRAMDAGLGEVRIARIRGVKGRGVFLYNVYPPVILDIYAIIVKPRRDLEIKYPCDVRMEDGAIIVIDRERAERVAEER